MAGDLSALGYSTFHGGNITAIYRSSLTDLKDLLRTKGVLGEESSLSGRSPIRIIKPDMVVRPLMHGGFFRHLTGRNFISPARTIREIEISSFLISKGIRTPEILGARIQEKGLFCHIEVITRLVPDSVDLLTWLETPREDSLDLLVESGKIVKRIHDLGVFHSDLHVKNILLDSSRSLWVLDLDKAYRLRRLPDILKRLNVNRFLHSLDKWSVQGRIHLPAEWESGFLQGYGSRGVI